MPSNQSNSRTQRAKQDTDSPTENDDGGLLVPTLVFVVGTAVGWLAYVFAALVVLNYLVRWDAIVTVIPGLSPSANFWLAVGVLVVIALALAARPGTLLAGWAAVGGIVAVAATYFVGWTQTIVIGEGLTLAFIGIVGFVKVVSMLPPWAVVFLEAERRR